MFKVYFHRRFQRYIGRFPRPKLGLGELKRTAGWRENDSCWPLSTHQDSSVVGCDANDSITGQSSKRVEFQWDYQWSDQEYEVVASEW